MESPSIVWRIHPVVEGGGCAHLLSVNREARGANMTDRLIWNKHHVFVGFGVSSSILSGSDLREVFT